ncbi:MAG: hypothetical protein HUU60_04250 [Armatimonadetes bacterium]|nr:hypothetical protein [Armatimonadota bacterium]
MRLLFPIVAAAFLCLGFQGQKATESDVMIGKRAPAFDVNDIKSGKEMCYV